MIIFFQRNATFARMETIGLSQRRVKFNILKINIKLDMVA